MGELIRRLHYLFHRSRLNEELRTEMESHREMAAAQGSRFGNTLCLRERAQEEWGWAWLDHVLQDMSWALRGLRRMAGSGAAMIVLLALGMGGVTALFGPLYTLVLRPLPFPHPSGLVAVRGALDVDYYANPTYFKKRRAYDRTLSGIAMYSSEKGTVLGSGQAEEISFATVSPEFFSTLGVRPRLGSDFPSSPKVHYSYDPDIAPQVIVSDSLWKRHLQKQCGSGTCQATFGTMHWNVLGVMPASFDYPSGTQVWVMGQVGLMQAVTIARLQPGVNRAQAQAALRAIESKDANRNAPPIQVESLHDAMLGDRKPLLLTLSAMAALFLCLACAGVANLLLARGVRRRREMVVRAVLGATRGRMVRQLLTESLALAIAGGVLGMALSVLVQSGLHRVAPQIMHEVPAFSPMTIVLVLVLILVVTLLCGLAPAFHATGAELNAALKEGNNATGAAGGRLRRFTAHELYACLQLVVAIVLLVSTGLLLHSVEAKIHYPLGFNADNLVSIHVNFPRPEAMTKPNQDWLKTHSYQSPRSREAEADHRDKTEKSEEALVAYWESRYQQLFARLKQVPGVESIAEDSCPPLQCKAFFELIYFYPTDGKVKIRNTGQLRMAGTALRREVGPGAFSTLGMRIVAGHDFQPEDIPGPDDWKHWNHFYDDTPNYSTHLIVNESFARAMWPGQNPIGKLVNAAGGNDVVIGVVNDIHETRDNPKIYQTFYVPFTERTPMSNGMANFIVRVRPGTRLSTLKDALPPADANTPPPTVEKVEETLGDLVMTLALVSGFSVLGIVVAGLGVYATATLMTAARTREMGVRLAIGANAEQLGLLTLWRSFRLALLALPAGLFGAWALSAGLKHSLFGIQATDPVSYAGSALLLMGIALAASLLPALRAASTDPAGALRYDG